MKGADCEDASNGLNKVLNNTLYCKAISIHNTGNFSPKKEIDTFRHIEIFTVRKLTLKWSVVHLKQKVVFGVQRTSLRCDEELMPGIKACETTLFKKVRERERLFFNIQLIPFEQAVNQWNKFNKSCQTEWRIMVFVRLFVYVFFQWTRLLFCKLFSKTISVINYCALFGKFLIWRLTLLFIHRYCSDEMGHQILEQAVKLCVAACLTYFNGDSVGILFQHGNHYWNCSNLFDGNIQPYSIVLPCGLCLFHIILCL